MKENDKEDKKEDEKKENLIINISNQDISSIETVKIQNRNEIPQVSNEIEMVNQNENNEIRIINENFPSPNHMMERKETENPSVSNVKKCCIECSNKRNGECCICTKKIFKCENCEENEIIMDNSYKADFITICPRKCCTKCSNNKCCICLNKKYKCINCLYDKREQCICFKML